MTIFDSTHPASDMLHVGAAARFDERPFVERVRAGDPLAFERLFRRYYPALCAFAARAVASEAVAEDIVQDVFRRIWERRESWTVETTVSAYLYRATRNGVFDYGKHERVVTRWEEMAVAATKHDGPVLEPPPDEMVYATELAAAIEDAAQGLPERCRQVFFLKWTHGLTYAEIADAMGISPKTVEMQMTKAYRALRERLQAFLP